jgi:capsular polysaccharide biosynthesis protein
VQDILAARQAETSSAAEEAPSLVQAVWRERWVVLACVIIAGLAGGLLSNLQQSRYTATSRIFLSATGDFDPLGQQQFVNDPGRFVADQVAVLQSAPVLKAVTTALQLDVPVARLRDDVKFTASSDSNVITVEATAADAQTAKQIADQIGVSYQAVSATKVQALAARATEQATNRAAVAEVKSKASVYRDGVSSVEPADLPEGPSSPQPIRNALILALIGFLAACGYALFTQSFSRRRAGPAEASAIFGAPILSEIPDRGRITAEDAIAAAYSEPGDAYRMAAVGLDYIRGTAPGVFLVTAPHDGAGSSLTALNLAAAAADHGRRVFLLNIEDTVRPQAEADAGVLRVPLHDLAQGRIDLGHAVERRAASRAQFGIIRLQVLQPVQGHPVADVQQILDQLPDDTDLVLLDSPPLPASSASFVLAGQVDAAVVVIDQATTPADLEELQRRCRLAGIPVAGVLVNHIRRQGVGVARRRRAKTNSVPPRMYDTSPRGLPILTGGSALGDGRLHLPDSSQGDQGPFSSFGQFGAAPNGHNGQYAAAEAPNGNGQYRPEYAEQAGEQSWDDQDAFGIPQNRPAGEVPWSSVTRVTPGWGEGDAGHGTTDSDQGRVRR